MKIKDTSSGLLNHYPALIRKHGDPPMTTPTFYIFDHGATPEQHDAICDKQTTLIAKRIVQNQRATPKMTVQQAIEWLQQHDPAYLAGDYHDSNIDG